MATGCNAECLILCSLKIFDELRQQLHWLPVRQRRNALSTNWLSSPIRPLTRTTSTPTYLSHLIHYYNAGHCLISADKLLGYLLYVPHTSLTLSAKAFSVSAPAVWHSLSFNCRSCKLFTVLLPVC